MRMTDFGAKETIPATAKVDGKMIGSQATAAGEELLSVVGNAWAANKREDLAAAYASWSEAYKPIFSQHYEAPGEPISADALKWFADGEALFAQIVEPMPLTPPEVLPVAAGMGMGGIMLGALATWWLLSGRKP